MHGPILRQICGATATELSEFSETRNPPPCMLCRRSGRGRLSIGAGPARRDGDRPAWPAHREREGGGMRYLLLVCAEENVRLSPEERAAIPGATQAWVTEMDGRGVRLEGHELRPVGEAATVRLREGERLVSDGPYAETKEQIAGFD